MTSAFELAGSVRSGERSARSVVEECLERIRVLNGRLNAFVHVSEDMALASAERVDAAVAAGEDPGPLAGVPVALKDNICVRGAPTTCCSQILRGWRPPYDATVVTRLVGAGAIVVGKTNMDEFAMGSSTETSCFGPTMNPHDPSRVPGGSSGGSAVAVAAGMTPLALGSDTGGSIRQPAALCGVVGVKPTYGLVSRYGLVAFASSLDQIGPFAASVKDAALCLQVIAGHDTADSTSVPERVTDLVEAARRGSEQVAGLRVGIIRELASESVAVEVADALRRAAEALAREGAVVEEVSLPSVRHALAAYYLIAPAEASSNLARYDGVRYGLRAPGATTADMNMATRTEGFGDEVKRRIMLGTYALSAGYRDAFYVRALKIRTLVARDFAEAYERVDVLMSPTSPTTAFRLGERLDDPLAMYASDVCTIPSNLAGHPAVSVPWGTDERGLPIGLQLMAPALGEERLFAAAAALERLAPRRPIPPEEPEQAPASASFSDSEEV